MFERIKSYLFGEIIYENNIRSKIVEENYWGRTLNNNVNNFKWFGAKYRKHFEKNNM